MSAPFDDGGPAFPGPDDYSQEGSPLYGPKNIQGMTLRQWYLGKILAGLCANPSIHSFNAERGYGLTNYTLDGLVEYAESIADTAIQARKPKPEGAG